MNTKKNMTEFVKYFSLGLWGLAAGATVAHVWNFPDEPFYAVAGVVTAIGVVYSIIRLAKTVKKVDE